MNKSIKQIDYPKLEELTPEEAREFLSSFLEITKKRWDEMIPALQNDKLKTDYKIESLEPVFLWVFERLKTVPREEDPEVPDWVRNTDSYKEGLFDFDKQSENMILGLSYYFGESFVRSFNNLYWTSGNTEQFQCNMPVIAGFKNDLELPPHNNIQAIFRRAIKDRKIDIHVSKMIKIWASDALK